MFESLSKGVLRLSVTTFLLLFCVRAWCYVPPGNPAIHITVLHNVQAQNGVFYATVTSSAPCCQGIKIFAPNLKRFFEMPGPSQHLFSLRAVGGTIVKNYDLAIDPGFIWNVRISSAFFTAFNEPGAMGWLSPGGSTARPDRFYTTFCNFHVYSTKTGNQVYKASLYDDGMPIAVIGRWLWTVRISNPANFFVYGRKPHIAFDIRYAATGNLLAEIDIPYVLEREYNPKLDAVKFARHHHDKNYSVFAYNQEMERFWNLVPYKISVDNTRLEVILGDSDTDIDPRNSVPKAVSSGFRVVWKFDQQK